jgi:Flp pilus assembly protein TadB
MAAPVLLAAGVLVILVAVIAWRRARARRRRAVDDRITEQQARENAAPLTRAILSGSPTHERNQR